MTAAAGVSKFETERLVGEFACPSRSVRSPQRCRSWLSNLQWLRPASTRTHHTQSCSQWMVFRPADLDPSFEDLGKAQNPVANLGKVPSIHLVPSCRQWESRGHGGQRLVQTARISGLFRAHRTVTCLLFLARRAGPCRKLSAQARSVHSRAHKALQSSASRRYPEQLDRHAHSCKYVPPVVLIKAQAPKALRAFCLQACSPLYPFLSYISRTRPKPSLDQSIHPPSSSSNQSPSVKLP